jgi:predicted HTH domain antitoxin
LTNTQVMALAEKMKIALYESKFNWLTFLKNVRINKTSIAEMQKLVCKRAIGLHALVVSYVTNYQEELQNSVGLLTKPPLRTVFCIIWE